MSEKLRKKKARRAVKRASRSPARVPGGRRGLETEKVFDESLNQVEVTRRGASLRGYDVGFVTAANRFAKDFASALGGTLKGMPWKERVDGGSVDHRAHLERLDAQTRLRELRERMGDEAIALTEAVAVYGFSAEAIGKKAGLSRAVVTDRIKAALRDVGEYYDRKPRRRSALLVAVSEMIEHALQAPE